MRQYYRSAIVSSKNAVVISSTLSMAVSLFVPTAESKITERKGFPMLLNYIMTLCYLAAVPTR